MYKVIYWGIRGAEFVKECETLDMACQIALQNRYGFSCIKDKNEDIVFDNLEDKGNGCYYFYKNIKPLGYHR